MKYFVIGDEDTVLGFGMVGVEGRRTDTAAEVKEAFQMVIKDHNYGIILITQSCADMIRSDVNHYLFTEQFPLILEIPDRKGPLPDRPDLKTIVDEAIGIKL